MILTNPSSIKKDKLEVLITEFDYKKNKTITSRFNPLDIELIAFSSNNASITKGALKLLHGKNVLFLLGKTVLARIDWSNKTSDLNHYSKKMAELQESKKKRLGFIFCKAVSSQRIQRLKELNSKRKLKSLSERIIEMKKMERQLIKVYKQKSSLMALEGNIAKHFFGGIKELLSDKLGFKQRLPENSDLYNVVLNLAHGFLRAKIGKYLTIRGVNDSFGFLHYQKDKLRPFLVWDFAEFWVAYLDKVCFYAVNKGIFCEKDLIAVPKGVSVRSQKILRGPAKKKVFELVNSRINENEIEKKVMEFKDFLNGKVSRFSWTT